jgi:hypothetical protein
MGFIVVLAAVSLLIFVCVSNTVFSLIERRHTKRQPSGLQTKE